MATADFELLIGKVAKATEAKIPDVDIVLLSRVPEFSGDVTEEKTESYEINLGGMTKTVEHKISYTVKAKWVAIGNPHRVTSPDFYGGETVLVFYHKQTNKYYFTSLFSDIDLRRTELMELHWSARNKDEEPSGDGTDVRSNSYRFIVDTENKQVSFTTSDANEEITTFKFLLDLLLGQFLIGNGYQDFINMIVEDKEDPENKPNRLHININGDSIENFLKDKWLKVGGNSTSVIEGDLYSNIKGTTFVKLEGDANIEINGKTNITGEGDLLAQYKGKIEIGSKADITLQSDTKIGITSLQDEINIFGGGSITMCTPTFNVIAPATSFTGAVQAASISVGGGSSASPAPIVIKAGTIDWAKYDESLEKLEEKIKIETEDGDDGSTEEEPEEEKQEEQDKEPAEVDGSPDNNDAVMDMQGKIELKSQTTATLESTSTMSLKGGYQKIEGSQGINITGAGVTLYDLLNSICTILTAMDSALSSTTTVTGTSVSGGAVTGVGVISYATKATDIAQVQSNNTKMKGAPRSRAITDAELIELSSRLNTIIKK